MKMVTFISVSHDHCVSPEPESTQNSIKQNNSHLQDMQFLKN